MRNAVAVAFSATSLKQVGASVVLQLSCVCCESLRVRAYTTSLLCVCCASGSLLQALHSDTIIDPTTAPTQALPRLVQLTNRVGDTIDAAGAGGEVDVGTLAKQITSDMMGTLLFDEDLQGVEGK